MKCPGRAVFGLGLVLWSFFVPLTAHSDIYRWVDADGVVHFTNTPTTGKFAFYRKEKTPSLSASAGGERIAEAIRRNASQFSLEEALIRAVIKAESDYNPRALSSKGAMGMMQLIPETARLMQVSDPYNAEENIRGGSRYLRLMLDEFGTVELALAAYNAGPGAVRRHRGIPPYQETRTYVERVKKFLQHYRQGHDTLL
ncbi:MAG: lytic transglycosylase domain-containing protein [Desulfuromonadales bacterium]|nr:lytic transglycosylase domain-containing protein [Desulfuromonadales bacterium]